MSLAQPETVEPRVQAEQKIKAAKETYLRFILMYARRGWPVFPLRSPRDGKCSCWNPECTAAGKHPYTEHGYKDATTNEETLRLWWEYEWPLANVGIRTGKEASIVVLDVDPRNGGDESLRQLEAQYGTLPVTPMVQSGGGGRHFYFQHPGGDIPSRELRAGLDIKGDGGSIVAPPSLHASGKGYEWEPGKTPGHLPLAPLPVWMLSRSQGARNTIWSYRGPGTSWTGGPILDGQRNVTLFKLACALRRQGMSEGEMITELSKINAQSVQPPYPAEGLQSIARSAAKYPAGISGSPMQRSQTILSHDAESVCGQSLGPMIADRLTRMHILQSELTSSPHSHDVLELALAVTTSLPVTTQEETAPVWLLVVGVPSSDKTNTILFLRESPTTYYLDTLTENSFASGFVDPRPKKTKQPDLLQLLHGKCLIIKDLTTLFSLREEKVKKILGDLQSIYDGEFAKATGTVGIIRHASRFALLGCITPQALVQHHNYMSRIGSRFLFYRVPRLTDEERAEGFDISWDGGDERKERLAALRRLAIEHIAAVGKVGAEWTPETPDQKEVFQHLAEFVAHGRAALSRQKSPGGEYEIASVQIEEPFRALQQLRNLGRALARVHGRTALTAHEFELLRRVVLSSLPADRKDVLDLFQVHPDGLTVQMCAAGINKSESRARGLLHELVRIGLAVEASAPSTGGRPATLYRVESKFANIVTKKVEPLDHLLDITPSRLSTQNSPQGVEDNENSKQPVLNYY